ncbi:MAG: hypothetical protein MJY62_01535 [Bacteroidales bacterium]|nr:hypothetical protein [Bacteroidales bacterium]
MKKFIFLVVVSLFAWGIPASAQLDKFSFGEHSVTSVRATSFTSMDGTVSLVVNNAGHKLTLTSISGMVYKKGTPFLIGTADDIVIPQGSSTVNVVGHASLPSMSALFTLIQDPTIDPAAYSIDVKFEIKRRMGTKVCEYKNIPLSRILKK